MSFRRKIILSQLILFLVFVAFLFPFIEETVSELVRESLEESTDDLLNLISSSASEQEMIERIKHQQLFVFFRISLINDKFEVIYDSHAEFMGRTALLPSENPEIAEALEEGVGYTIGESKVFLGKFAYVAQKFSFQNRLYLLRTAFPFSQIQDLTKNFELGFLIFSFLSLLFFTTLTWLIFNRLSKPIRKIISAIRPYQLGQESQIAQIILERNVSEKDEFYQLASTLNSLSDRIRQQIQSITEERNEKEAILESLGEGVIAVNQAMEVTYVNYMGSRMLGTLRRHLVGKPFPEQLEKSPPELLQKCKQLLIKCQQQGQILTLSFSFGDQKKTYFDLVAAPKALGSGAIVVLQDKTSHYKVLEMGKDFVANSSHELRTPITIIKGFAETLHDLPELSKEMLKEITEKIMRSCERMENLVKSLLTLADLENFSASRFKECDLISLIENCKHTIHSIYPDCAVDFQKNADKVLISADSQILELAIMNLLENAVKYSKPPAYILIKVDSLDDEVKVVITDRGIGIPPADLEQIFERFYTVDKAHSRRLGGAGLGLSIVKTIVEKHNGTISVVSELNKGTSFTLTFPK